MGRMTTEASLSLDLAYLEERNLLQPGNSLALTWTFNGGTHSQRTSTIGVSVLETLLRLQYQVTQQDTQDAPYDVDDRVWRGL